MEFDFSQPVDAIDKVPEQFRSLYSEGADGKFLVADQFKGVAGAFTGVYKTLKTVREEAAQAKKGVVDLSPLAEFGADPASIKAKFDERVAELVAKGGDATKAVEKVRGEMTAANKAALDAANAKTTALQNQLYTHLVDSEAVAAIAEAKGTVELLMPFLKNQVKVTDQDGKFIVSVIDAAGEQRYSGVTGSPMTIKELVAEMKANTKYGKLFDSEAAGGTGTPPGSGRRQAPPAKTELTANQRISAGLKKTFGNMAR